MKRQKTIIIEDFYHEFDKNRRRKHLQRKQEDRKKRLEKREEKEVDPYYRDTSNIFKEVMKGKFYEDS